MALLDARVLTLFCLSPQTLVNAFMLKLHDWEKYVCTLLNSLFGDFYLFPLDHFIII